MSQDGNARPGTTGSVASRSHSSHTLKSTATSTRSHSQPSAAANKVVVEDKGGDYFARNSTLYTGPEGLRPHRVTAVTDPQYVGNKDRSPEDSGNLDYMFRLPKHFPFPKAKNGQIGETGWEQEKFKGFKIA